MLLRRMIEHVKAQNWTAVGLDFVIVVMGVFLGIQFSNWNDSRSAARAERQILNRLHDEIDSIEEAQSEVLAFAASRFEELTSARLVLLGKSDRDLLTDAECTQLGNSHLPLTPQLVLPLLEELSATGDIALIKDETVVGAIANLSLISATTDKVSTELRPFRVPLATRFSNHMTFELKASSDPADVDGYDVLFSCDTASMKNDTGFLNAMGENIGYAYFVYEIGILREVAALAELRRAVGTALGLPNGDENA